MQTSFQLQKIAVYLAVAILGAAGMSFSSALAYEDVTIPLGASIKSNPFSLSPSIVNIKTNETVVWYNQDDTIHSVTTGTPQYGFDGRIDSGPIQPGQSFSYTFSKQGVYQYFCIFHPWMTGAVNVGIGGQVEPLYQISVSTDKSSYRAGDNILVSGQVSKFIPNEIITVWITDSQGKGIAESHVETENGSKFETSMPAGGALWIPGSTYTIFAQYGSRSEVATSQIEYEPNSKPSIPPPQQPQKMQPVSSFTSYPVMHKVFTADENSYVTVQTDRHIYLPGERVKIFGTVWGGVLEKVGGPAYLVTAYQGTGSNSVLETVSVQVRDGNGDIMLNRTVVADSNGIYSTTLEIPQNITSAYTVSAAIETKAGLTNALPPDVSEKLGSETSFAAANPSVIPLRIPTGDYDVQIASNSTISGFKVVPEQKMLSFTVKGENGTKGVTSVTIPKQILGGNLQVYLDGVRQPYGSDNVIMTSDNSNVTTLELNYHHSSHVFEIVGTQAAPSIVPAPEFSSVATLVFAAGTMSIIATRIIFRRI